MKAKNKIYIAILLVCVLTTLVGCTVEKPNSFFDNATGSDSSSRETLSRLETSRSELSRISSSQEGIISSINSSISEPEIKIEITKFFNSHTHPDLFYIKSTGFEFTQKQVEINAIVTEGYVTEADKITSIYMIVYPMLGFTPEGFDKHTNKLYSFYDFELQSDGSFRLDITDGDILKNVQLLSASTSMVMLAGQAKAEGILILDENGVSYTITDDGNLAIISKGEVKPIPDSNSNPNSSITSSASDTSSTQSTISNSENSTQTGTPDSENNSENSHK